MEADTTRWGGGAAPLGLLHDGGRAQLVRVGRRFGGWGGRREIPRFERWEVTKLILSMPMG
jgi:hypothetical protein